MLIFQFINNLNQQLEPKRPTIIVGPSLCCADFRRNIDLRSFDRLSTLKYDT